MRRCENRYRRASEVAGKRINRRWGKERNERLALVLDSGPIRSLEPVLVFVITTFNPFSGVENVVEIVKEIDLRKAKYAVYLNGERWRNGWSRTRFCKWLFNKIDRVID